MDLENYYEILNSQWILNITTLLWNICYTYHIYFEYINNQELIGSFLIFILFISNVFIISINVCILEINCRCIFLACNIFRNFSTLFLNRYIFILKNGWNIDLD